jgi:hypothetical protein
MQDLSAKLPFSEQTTLHARAKSQALPMHSAGSAAAAPEKYLTKCLWQNAAPLFDEFTLDLACSGLRETNHRKPQKANR